MRQRSDDTYSRLVLLPENQFAYAAVSRLQETAAPIVTIFGPAGVGKTHLVRQTIGDLQRQSADQRLRHVTAGEFMAQLTNASQAKSISEFQDRFRQSDFLVCEDLQSLEGRSEPQQQLLAIIDEIIAKGGRVLLTCRKSPGELTHYSSKLRSRSFGGVCAPISLPGVTSRQKLLMHFAAVSGMNLDEALADHIAQLMAISPRELRGVVTQLQVIANQRRLPVNHEVAEVVIRASSCDRQPTISQITKIVATAFNVTVSELKSAGRAQAVVVPRQIAMFAAREWGQRPYAVVGKYFHRRSHSTIVHACQRVRERLESDTAFRQKVDRLREQLITTSITQHRLSTTR